MESSPRAVRWVPLGTGWVAVGTVEMVVGTAAHVATTSGLYVERRVSVQACEAHRASTIKIPHDASAAHLRTSDFNTT